MNEILHANIFFIISSVATVIFCILVSLVLYQVWKITKMIRQIVERIEEASELVAEDVAHVRQFVKNGGLFTRILSFIMGAQMARKKKRADVEEDDED